MGFFGEWAAEDERGGEGEGEGERDGETYGFSSSSSQHAWKYKESLL